MGTKRFRQREKRNNVQDCVSNTVKILKTFTNANDNVEFDYALAA